jgi:hypothetical protein
MDSTSSAREGDRFQSAVGSTGAEDFKSDPPSRLDSFSDYRSHRSEGSQEPLVRRTSHTSDIDASSFSSERSTTRGSTLDTTFTSVASSRGFPRGGSPSSTHTIDRGSRHDNQRELDDPPRASRYELSTWNRHDEPWRADRPSRTSARPTREHSESRDTTSSDYARPAGSSSTRTLLDSRRLDNRLQSDVSDGKADALRTAESPARSHSVATTRARRHDESESTGNALEFSASALTAGFENQDEELRSPTNSETSNAPSSPDSEHDFTTLQIRDRYPKPSVSSPVSSDRSTTKRMRASSPCSSVATSRSSASRASTKPLERLQIPAQSAMSDLREDLYAFRKQMREVFIRVEDVVDVHRSLFKSDPSTGSPVWNGDLQQEAEQLAATAFEQLAALRKHFARLAKDFARSEPPSDGWTERSQRQMRRPVITPLQTPTQHQTSVDDEAASSKGSEVPHDVASNGSEDDDDSSVRHGSQERCDSSQDDNEDAPSDIMADSERSSASTFLSAQLPSRWRSADSIATSDISARARSSSAASNASSSLPEQCSKPSDAVDTDSIFQGWWKYPKCTSTWRLATFFADYFFRFALWLISRQISTSGWRRSALR